MDNCHAHNMPLSLWCHTCFLSICRLCASQPEQMHMTHQIISQDEAKEKLISEVTFLDFFLLLLVFYVILNLLAFPFFALALHQPLGTNRNRIDRETRQRSTTSRLAATAIPAEGARGVHHAESVHRDRPTERLHRHTGGGRSAYPPQPHANRS